MRTSVHFSNPKDAYAEALCRIEEWQMSGDTEAYLNLCALGLETVPPEVFQLTELRELNLWYNYLPELPPEIGGLKKLKTCALLEQIAAMAGLDDVENILAQRDW